MDTNTKVQANKKTKEAEPVEVVAVPIDAALQDAEQILSEYAADYERMAKG